MSGHGEKRTRKQEAAIAALLTEKTIEEAAVKAGVAYRTLKTWLRQPDFRRDYREARRRVLDDAVALLQRSCTEAAETLARNLNCGKPEAENRAAVAVLDQAFRGLEALDLVAEVEELKRMLADANDGTESGNRPPEATGPG
jgi:hypothetical protein